MQETILTQDKLITKLILITSKLLNIETLNYQLRMINVINHENLYNANIKFIEMMNIKL